MATSLVDSQPFQITPMSFGLAPEKLWQAINPWTFNWNGDQFGFINISLGDTNHPEVERAVLDEVGSYGRQLGHIGDALAVLIRHFDRKGLSEDENLALDTLKVELAAIEKVKERALVRKATRVTMPFGAFC